MYVNARLANVTLVLKEAGQDPFELGLRMESSLET